MARENEGKHRPKLVLVTKQPGKWSVRDRATHSKIIEKCKIHCPGAATAQLRFQFISQHF